MNRPYSSNSAPSMAVLIHRRSSTVKESCVCTESLGIPSVEGKCPKATFVICHGYQCFGRKTFFRSFQMTPGSAGISSTNFLTVDWITELARERSVSPEELFQLLKAADPEVPHLTYRQKSSQSRGTEHRQTFLVLSSANQGTWSDMK